jgi:two-component system NtrC family response regulator
MPVLNHPRPLLIMSVDDSVRRPLCRHFAQHQPLTITNTSALKTALHNRPAGIVLLDMDPPSATRQDTEMLAVLDQILATAPDSRVILMGTPSAASTLAEGLRHGAHDAFFKPVTPLMLEPIVEQALRQLGMNEHYRAVDGNGGDGDIALPGVIAASAAMRATCQTIERLAPTDISVLLLGESGTGKEVLARALHQLSPRAQRPFVAVTAAAIPENLLESELFGYERGAYTGASQQTQGKFEMAQGGTFFLDEIGDLPLSLQPKLLRVLQERSIERVGGRRAIPLDIRIICATHRTLAHLIEEGRFREDLYYRINEMIVEIPPLRQRDGDSLLLARKLLERDATALGRPQLKGYTAEALVALAGHDWPGNIREMEHRIKRAVVMATGRQINARDLDLTPTLPKLACPTLREARCAAEREVIHKALAAAGDNRAQAAALLDISRPTLYSLLGKMGHPARI